MTRRPKLGRAVAAITGASVALLMAAIPASAEDPDPAVFTVTGEQEAGLPVKVHFDPEGKDEVQTIPTALQEIQATVGDAKFPTYTFRHDVVLAKGKKVAELPWLPDGGDDASKQTLLAKAAESGRLDKVNWALRHSYPVVTVDALSLNGLTNKEAIAGTQAAIWGLLFDATLDADNAANVKAVFKYLTGDKNTGAVNENEPKLEVTLPTLTGTAGERIGPVKVSTTARELTLTVTGGVKVIDKDGKELAAKDIKDGTELFVQVPAATPAGQGSFELKAAWGFSRLFLGPVGDSDSDVKIAPGEGEPPVIDIQFHAFAQAHTKSAGVAVSWQAQTTTTPETPAPQASNGGGLADTGVSIYVPLGLGVLLLAAGAGALLMVRRRGRA